MNRGRGQHQHTADGGLSDDIAPMFQSNLQSFLWERFIVQHDRRQTCQILSGKPYESIYIIFRIQKKEKIILLQWSWSDEVTQEIAWGGGILEKTSSIVRTQSWPDDPASLPDPETLRAAEEIMGSGSARASRSLHSGSLPDQQVWHFYPQFPPVRLFRLVSRPSGECCCCW